MANGGIWSEYEIFLLTRMRRKNRPLSEMAAKTGRSEQAIYDRLRTLPNERDSKVARMVELAGRCA